MFTKKSLLIAIIILALTGLIAGLLAQHYFGTKNLMYIDTFHGTYLENPRSIDQFSLKGSDGKPFDNKRMQGRWTMMFFGFTSCGYLCPTSMAEIGKMYKILEKRQVKNLPQVYMITLDPERGSLDKLKDYVQAFDPHFYGARADDNSSVKKMTREMGVMYAKVAMPKTSDPKAYDIQHSGTIILFNPEGKLSAFFTTPHHAMDLAKDYQLLAG